LSGTSQRSKPSRGRGLALGATAVVAVGLTSAYASAIGAQTTSDPIRTELVSVDGDGTPQSLPDTASPAISDTGGVVAYDTVAPDTPSPSMSFEGRRVWIRDRAGGTSRPAAETGSVAPGVSGNGCIVAYTVVADNQAKLTAVDLCATATGSPLPIGSVLDTVAVESNAIVAAPSLSIDGSTVVWSTGSEVRRYVRPAADAAHARTDTFDTVTGGTPDVVTGIHTDVSADGGTVAFVAGPGTSPFEPAPANIYVWTAATPQVDAQLISATPSGEPASSDSTSPTITADGTFLVFQSTSLELPVVGSSPVVAPFLVGVDLAGRTAQVLVDDADLPTVSADGQHVVYRRGDAVRVLSSGATSSTDHESGELAGVRPIGAISISQFGRWLVFASAVAPATGESSETKPAPAVWAVDRTSSNPDTADTTTTTVPPAPPTPTAPPSTAVPEGESATTVPTTTLAPIVPPSPPVAGGFPSVGLPAPRPVGTSFPRIASGADDGISAFAAPVSFDPTVIDAGRRTQPVILTNAGARTLQVESVLLDVADVFTLVGDSCSGTPLAPGSSCSVEVQFAPITVGPVSATVTFRLADGSLVVAQLDGEGVAEPTLDLLPAVAGAGQTVTVFGAGFPPGVTVELSRPGSSTVEPIAVDADGTFAHVIVVLPNTPVGLAVLSVSGQPDAFGDVGVELLVSSRGSASAGAALRGGWLGGALGR
jgi:Tol biopolymer transport system component